MRFVGTNPQVMELHLCVRPGKRQGAVKSPFIPVTIREIEDLLTRVRGNRCKHEMGGFPRSHAYRASQADAGVKNGTYRVGKFPAVDDRNRVAKVMPTPQKTSAIGFVFQVADGFALHEEHMRHPN